MTRFDEKLILVPIAFQYDYEHRAREGLMRFIKRYNPGWCLQFPQWPVEAHGSEMLFDERVAGLLFTSPVLRTLPDRERLRQTGKPVVCIGHAVDGFTSIDANDRAVARLAFEHLRSRGFRRFAFFHDESWFPFQARQKVFRQTVLDAGLAFIEQPEWDAESLWHGPERLAPLARWVDGLPRPIAIFAGNVERAFTLLTVCRERGVHVPDEIAVLGCDQNETICSLATPPLSTIDHGMVSVGFEAAALLHRMIRGEQIPPEHRTVEPAGVIERQSTSSVMVEDPALSEAASFIEEHALSGITAADVAAEASISRRRLEMSFKQQFGRTIHQQILHRRIEHAKHLLTDTDLKMPEIATWCAFSCPTHLQHTFKKLVGTTPGVYRRQHRSA
ncbi:MAG: substrate-binding domain-containing protein [Phycisphaeraceae bacterium]